MDFWRKKVLVTGGNGFLGAYLCDRLRRMGATVFAPAKNRLNLLIFDSTYRYLFDIKPEIVIHCAAFHGGIQFIMNEAGRAYYDNLIMGAHLMEVSRMVGVEKYVSIGSNCSYPDRFEVFEEKDLWEGLPHESVGLYGMSKKMAVIQGMAYKRQYGFNSIHLILSNLYGPGGCLDSEKRSHVQEALIKRFCEAKKKDESVTVWGTGNTVREFCYVDDAAEGVLLASEKYNSLVPLNIGTGTGSSIKELVGAITKALDFKNEIHWDLSKPEGKGKKILNIERMIEHLGWKPRTPLADGIKRTVEWYLTTYPTVHP